MVDSITISDDLSHNDKIEERQFLALRDRSAKLTPVQVVPSASAHALQDYQMQLMLLEQQNKKRLMMARMEQDSMGLLSTIASDSTSLVTPLPKRSHLEAISGSSSGSLDADVLDLDVMELQSFISRLQDRAKQMGAAQTESGPTYSWRILYRLLEEKLFAGKEIRKDLSAPFFDPPQWMSGQDKKGKLQCELPVDNLELFLEKNKDISFIVYRTYFVPSTLNGTVPHRRWNRTKLPELTINETIQPITEDLSDAIEMVLSSKPQYADIRDGYQKIPELHAPFLFVFHQRDEWSTIRDSLTPSCQDQMSLFWDYVIQNYGEEYAAADASISRGEISSKYLKYLFKPEDVLVQRKQDHYSGWVARSWARQVRTYTTTRSEANTIMKKGIARPFYGTTDAADQLSTEKVTVQDWNIDAWRWEFDGNFQRRNTTLTFSIIAGEEPGDGNAGQGLSKSRGLNPARDSIAISDLEVIPLQYASKEIVAQLRRRGKAFWKCRNRCLVSYQGKENDMISVRYFPLTPLCQCW